MHHIVAPRRRRERTRAAEIVVPIARTEPAERPLSSLNVVAVQILCGFLGPLPLIQLGHWLFGWNSVTIMFGGQ